MALLTTVPARIWWDFSFPDFSEVSVVYSGLQIKMFVVLLITQMFPKSLMLKQSVFLYRTDVSLCLDTAVTTAWEKTSTF